MGLGPSVGDDNLPTLTALGPSLGDEPASGDSYGPLPLSPPMPMSWSRTFMTACPSFWRRATMCAGLVSSLIRAT